MGQGSSRPGSTLPPLSNEAWENLVSIYEHLEKATTNLPEGVYRVPGLASNVKRALETIKRPEKVNLQEFTLFEWASAIKDILRTSAPLCGYDSYALITAAKTDGELYNALCTALKDDEVTFQRIKRSCIHLARLAAYSSVTKMPDTNLARMWCRYIVRKNEDPPVDLETELSESAKQYSITISLIRIFSQPKYANNDLIGGTSSDLEGTSPSRSSSKPPAHRNSWSLHRGSVRMLEKFESFMRGSQKSPVSPTPRPTPASGRTESLGRQSFESIEAQWAAILSAKGEQDRLESPEES